MKRACVIALVFVATLIAMVAGVAVIIGSAWLGLTAPGRYPDQMFFAAMVLAGSVVVCYWALVWTLAIPMGWVDWFQEERLSGRHRDRS